MRQPRDDPAPPAAAPRAWGAARPIGACAVTRPSRAWPTVVAVSPQVVPPPHAATVPPTPKRPPRRRFLCAAFASGLGMAAPGLQACEFQTGWLRVTHPWTRATADGADSAVLCMRIDEVAQDDRLIHAQSPVAAGAEMVTASGPQRIDLPLLAGSTLEMHEDGLHLRLTGLRHGLQAGREYPLTLEFERSGLLLARLSVDFTAMRFR